MSTASAAGFHHVELWVPDLEAAALTWGWLLGRLGWTASQFPFALTDSDAQIAGRLEQMAVIRLEPAGQSLLHPAS